MAKGVAIRFGSYEQTIPKLLDLIKFNDELKRHERIILKPTLSEDPVGGTQKEFMEEVLRYCVRHKAPGAEILIAEGCDGEDTLEMFDRLGYRDLAETYGVGLMDLNNVETEEVHNNKFIRFESIHYPTILKESFVVSLPLLRIDDETQLSASLDAMKGAFPAKHYKGLFTKRKKKLEQHPLKYQIHDIVQCKSPDFTIIDASTYDLILAGKPLDMDKQAAKVLGLDWREVGHLRLIDESLDDSVEQKDINA